jgi:hypothetical protein
MLFRLCSNSLQCCCAGIFNMDLEMVPNFFCHPDGYMMAFNSWIASKGLILRKIDLTKAGEIRHEQMVSSVGVPYITHGSICILQTKTHFMVGQIDKKTLKINVIMDPSSENTNFDEKAPNDAFFVYRSTTNYNKFYYSDRVEGYVGKNDLHQYSLRKS